MAAPTEPYWNQVCIDPIESQARSAHVRYCSPFAASLIDRHPAWYEQLAISGRLDRESPPDSARAGEWISTAGLDDGLRDFRNQEMLRIIWRDLNGLATLGETFSDLTRLAEVCLQQALDAHHQELSVKHGQPLDASGDPLEAVVIGLGKLGGGELNLSSDIDVIFTFPAGGRCDGPRNLSAEEFFSRLSRAVISTLGEIRHSGFCFRVDTRLRPFGQAGPIACSFAALEQYYQREGRDWERYALVKARPVAGNMAAGAQLLESLRPFVYRRYIDFGAIEALREMQALIRSETARDELLVDIKRGPGGIREIEFLAQGFQLLRGGREPILQTPSLALALQAVERLGLLPENVVEDARRDYAFLRQVENRLQAMRDQQTHRIPEGEDLERLCRGLGLPAAAAFEQRLAEVRSRVSRVFDQTWSANEPAGAAADEAQADLAGWQRQWAEWRAQPPESPAPGDGWMQAAIHSFLSGLARRPLGRRALNRLDRFMPMLLQRMARDELNAEAGNRLLDLVQVIAQRSAYLALLAERPEALDRTVELFGRSQWVALRVARFPELLDELIDPALGHHIPDRATLESATSRKLEYDDDESALAGLNYLKQANCLRLAVTWLEGRIAGTAMQEALTRLAEVMVKATFEMARRELASRHGEIPGAAVAIIAYGSLGARELGIDSDLDLVFLYRKGAGDSAGKRPLAAERWFARLAQRMVALLTVLTPSGKLYEIDTRLRPNGQSGLLVSSIDAFETYQLEAAWTWEAQALTRARAIAGDPELMAAFEGIRNRSLLRSRDPDRLRSDLSEMRERIRASHGDGLTSELAVKHAPGGLVDLGFIAQLGVLDAAAGHPEVTEPTGASAQFDRLRDAGWLDPAQHQLLQSRLIFLRETRFRIELDAGDASNQHREAGEEGEAVARLLRELVDE